MVDGLTVGICTKNRWDDLAITLAKVRANLGEVPVIVIDDGSTTPAPDSIRKVLGDAQFLQDGENHGYIARRNQIASMVATKFYLSLDDDSYPVDGALVEAVAFASSIPALLCLGFPVVNGSGGSEVAPHEAPRPVRHFIGCAHLMRVDRFMEMGGYRAELVHQGEEAEIAARGLNQGFECWQFPGVTVLHNYSLTARNWDRMDFYGARNRYLWNDWFAPPSLRLALQTRLLARRLVLCATTRRTGHVRGWLAGMREARSFREFRMSFSHDRFRAWNSMPTW